MKKRSKLGIFNRILAVIFVVVLIANVVVIATKDVPVAATAEEDAAAADTAVIDEFAANTYGGVEFADVESVVNYYNEAYNKTKAQTREYINDQGQKEVWYTMLGEEKLQVSNIMIEGKENSMINNLVPGIVGGLFSAGITGLSPSANRNPENDVDEENKSLTTSYLTAEDILAANVKDNGDGTITLQLQPKQVNISHKCIVDYKGGYATVTIDTATGLITTADYHMEAHISVNHANVAVLKDKSATLLVTYDVHYPASEEYLAERNVKVA